MHCERNEPVPDLLVEVASTLSWFEVKQISCPSGDPAGVGHFAEAAREAGRGEYGPTSSRSKKGERLLHDQKLGLSMRTATLNLQLLDERVGQCTTECESGCGEPPRGSSIAGISIASGVVPLTIASSLEIRIIFARQAKQSLGDQILSQPSSQFTPK